MGDLARKTKSGRPANRRSRSREPRANERRWEKQWERGPISLKKKERKRARARGIPGGQPTKPRAKDRRGLVVSTGCQALWYDTILHVDINLGKQETKQQE